MRTSLNLPPTTAVTDVPDDQTAVFFFVTDWIDATDLKEVRVDELELLASVNLHAALAFQTTNDPSSPPNAVTWTALANASRSADGKSDPVAWEDLTNGLAGKRFVRFGFAVRRAVTANSTIAWGRLRGRLLLLRRC